MSRFDGIRLLRIFTTKGQTCEAFINIHDVFERQAHGESGISAKIITRALDLLDFWPNRSAMYKNIQSFRKDNFHERQTCPVLASGYSIQPRFECSCT